MERIFLNFVYTVLDEAHFELLGKINNNWQKLKLQYNVNSLVWFVALNYIW